ncbi:hypothetical protein FF38_00159 [Lucilia cuprina]|uniref:Uncharacterized protein n=1 Tax=Lucilia cuprina TaxID=7375 RepID=A0A0L0BRB3_LUCCU|nr:hypothetical protein FF38_00159 [Lucilia cuprina]
MFKIHYGEGYISRLCGFYEKTCSKIRLDTTQHETGKKKVNKTKQNNDLIWRSFHMLDASSLSSFGGLSAFVGSISVSPSSIQFSFRSISYASACGVSQWRRNSRDIMQESTVPFYCTQEFSNIFCCFWWIYIENGFFFSSTKTFTVPTISAVLIEDLKSNILHAIFLTFSKQCLPKQLIEAPLSFQIYAVDLDVHVRSLSLTILTNSCSLMSLFSWFLSGMISPIKASGDSDGCCLLSMIHLCISESLSNPLNFRIKLCYN